METKKRFALGSDADVDDSGIELSLQHTKVVTTTRVSVDSLVFRMTTLFRKGWEPYRRCNCR